MQIVVGCVESAIEVVCVIVSADHMPAVLYCVIRTPRQMNHEF